MSHEMSTVLASCGLTVGLNMAPPPPGPMMRKWPGRSAAKVVARHTNKRRALRRETFIGSYSDITHALMKRGIKVQTFKP